MSLTPKANPEKILDIIHDAYHGKVVIPKFQRSFVWAREDIESLLISILRGYFIGTFLMLDTPPEKSLFPYDPIEGLIDLNKNVNPRNHPTVRVVLDGQQRITSLFYALYEPPNVPLKLSKYSYRFFFKLDEALDGDPTDAIIGVSQGTRRRREEIRKLVQAHMAIPFSLMGDPDKFNHWLFSEQRSLTSEQDRHVIQNYYNTLQGFMIPVVSLSHETGRDNIVNIFEKINSSGVTLSLFDLAVARLYLNDVPLRELWRQFEKQFASFDPDGKVEVVIKQEFPLKLIALWEGKEPRKGTLLDIVDLKKDVFEPLWDKATNYLLKAHARMSNNLGGYGAFKRQWIPYTTLIVPLAALLHHIETSRAGEAGYRKIDRWYWGNVLTQRYDSAVDTKTFQDAREVAQWIDGERDTPSWLTTPSVAASDLDVDETRSALYRGLMCMVTLRGAKDFITGNPANLNECHDDHIFPKSKFEKHANVNSILNRTLIAACSNIIKSNKKPSEYLPLFLEKHGNDETRLLQTLASHLITQEAYTAMKNDDFEGFVQARRDALLKIMQNFIPIASTQTSMDAVIS